MPRVSATAAVEAPKLGGRPILCELSDENVRAIVDLSVFVPRVNGGDGGVTLVPYIASRDFGAAAYIAALASAGSPSAKSLTPSAG